EIGELAPWGARREMRFELVNSGKRALIVTAIKLRILDHGECEESRRTKVAAPVTVYKHRVELRPDKTEYDIPGHLYSHKLPPLQYAPDEVEAFLVSLVARQPHWYLARVVTHWYDTHDPNATRITESQDLLIGFPREVATREPA